MFKGWLARGAVLIGVVSSGLVATQSSAMADFSWCPNGKFCFSTEGNGNGSKWSYWVSGMRGGVEMTAAQRSASSVWNRTGGTVYLYDTANCVSNYYVAAIGPGAATNLSLLPYGSGNWDNRVKSFDHSENLSVTC